LNNISPFTQWIIKGLILILALALDLWQKSTKRKEVVINGTGVD